MLPVEEARARILAALSPTGAETVALPEAWNRVLAAPVAARLTQPPAALSAMDGYALRAGDGAAGATLRVVGSAPAGHPFAGRVGPGEAVRIFTGAVLPEGADAILLQEDAEAGDGVVTLREAVRPGRWIRPEGLDFRAGDILLHPGRRLTARDIGLAAAANHPWLSVHRAPRIAILATGDEIVLPGEALPRGGIVSSNAHALAALVRAYGGQPVLLPIAADRVESIAASAGAARGCDLLVTTGGASVGEHDLVQKALAPLGLAVDFWKIAMRPGKPLIWGRLGETPLLGLPGNPVSALTCAVLFLGPAMARLGGLPDAAPPFRRAVTAAALPQNDAREDYLRAFVTRGEAGQLMVTAAQRQDSSMLRVLAGAEALLRRAPHAPALPQGETVEILLLSELGL
ncbi:gephyrin-like molybdotransferase Glp [Pseudoroseomonas cervicalis]|uniref:Molybdopterin molybdenumtransferase n=1 Tax=Pseudoroseomonas cervicalis ATCC 49957 TaxID=525371 RepID=D5RPE4_9PROT|nr:gephyrin-like molybdotransferase Glp [Pseudoroseomonas cervicalis]EFH10822.1 molybdenum cofactor synthesis domain protein [Pseudoroseomonas cervicalis ATCC 49957]